MVPAEASIPFICVGDEDVAPEPTESNNLKEGGKRFSEPYWISESILISDSNGVVCKNVLPEKKRNLHTRPKAKVWRFRSEIWKNPSVPNVNGRKKSGYNLSSSSSMFMSSEWDLRSVSRRLTWNMKRLSLASLLLIILHPANSLRSINRLLHYLQNSESSQIIELRLFLKLQCNLKAWRFVELIEESTVVSTANGREHEFLTLLIYWIVLNFLSELNFLAFLNAEATVVKKSSSCHMESRRTPADLDVACVASSSVRK